MKKSDTAVLITGEPIGIVISRGPEADEAPALFAYAYSDAPETDDEPVATAVA